jgi:hypothetical protein
MSSNKPPSGRRSSPSARSVTSLSSLSSISSLRFPAGITRKQMRSGSSLKSDSSASSSFLVDALQYTPKGRHLKSCMSGAPAFRPAQDIFNLGLESGVATPISLSSISSLDPVIQSRISGFLTTPVFSCSNSGRNSRNSGRGSRISRRLSGSSVLSSDIDLEPFRINSAGSVSRVNSADSVTRVNSAGSTRGVISRTHSADSVLSISDADAVCSRTRSSDSILSVVSEGRAELCSILSEE